MQVSNCCRHSLWQLKNSSIQQAVDKQKGTRMEGTEIPNKRTVADKQQCISLPPSSPNSICLTTFPKNNTERNTQTDTSIHQESLECSDYDITQFYTYTNNMSVHFTLSRDVLFLCRLSSLCMSDKLKGKVLFHTGSLIK